MSKDLLGAADAILGRNNPEPAPVQESSFVRGLRSGTLGAGSQLATLGGAVADRFGFDPSSLYDSAKNLSLRAQQEAPRITSYKDVGGLGDAFDYATGMIGQSLPAMAGATGAALLTRGGAVPKMLASTGAMVPLETGDILQRQQALGQPVDLADAGLGGVASAALQGVVPGVTALKLAGKAGSLAAKGGVAAKVAKNVAGEALVEGATEGGSEALKQRVAGQPLDTDAILENAIGGAVAGGAMGLPGAAGDLVHGAKDSLKAKGAALSEKLGAAKAEAQDGAEKASQAASEGLQGFYDRVGTAKKLAGDAYDRVIKGKPLQDDPAYVDTPADSPAYQGLLSKLDNEHIAKAKEWGQGMLDKADAKLDEWLTPERRAELDDAMSNLGDQANRIKVATMAKAKDAYTEAKAGADKLKTATTEWYDSKGKELLGKGFDAAEAGVEKVAGAAKSLKERLEEKTKKSEDYSGVRKAISDELLPLIEEYNPGLLHDSDAMTIVAESVRKAVQLMQAGEALPKPVRNALYDTIGPKTDLLLDKVSRMSGAPGAKEKFYDALNKAEGERRREDNLHDTMMKSVRPELQDSLKAGAVRQDARDLMAWMRRGDTGTAEDKFRTQKVKAYLEERYGKNADKVLEAVEKANKKEDLELDKEAADNGVDDEADPNAGEEAGSTLTVAEPKKDGTDALAPDEVKGLKWEGGKGSDDRRTSPRALQTEAGTFDAVKITGSNRLEHYERPSLERDAHAFADGIAKLTEHTGKKITVPDSTVINERGTTWGEAKKLLTQDRGPSKDDMKLSKLRDDYREARAQNDIRRMDKLAKDAQLLLDKRDKAMVQEDFESTHAQESLAKDGKHEADPLNDPIQLAAATMKPDELAAKEDYSGQPLSYKTKADRNDLLGALDSKIQRLENMTSADGKGINRTARALAAKARDLQPLFESMKPMDQAAMLALVKATKLSDMAGTINALHTKYGADKKVMTIEQEQAMRNAIAKPRELSQRILEANKAAPEVAAKDPKERLVERARSGDPELLTEIAKHDDAAQLQRALDHLNKEGVKGEAVEALNKRIGELAQDPNTALNLQKNSAQTTGSAKANTPDNTQVMADYLDRVLGPSVKRAWANISHAGEFDAATETIRVSVHALNPLSTAHHEALHAFLKKLRDSGDNDVVRTLLKAADSPVVRKQLEKLLANEPEALKQLGDAEERAAYMYQFWAADPKSFKVGPETKGVLTKLQDFFMRVLGMWTNDERALHIMEHFHQGDFAKDPSAFARAMDAAGRNAVIEKARSFTQPLANISDSIMGAGAARLRDTGIPALRELADAMKLHGTSEGGDAGFIPAARTERTRMMNAIADRLTGYSQEHLDDALNALQTKGTAATPEGRLAARAVRDALDDAFKYMTDAGVKVNDLGLGKDYFPRVYDLDYISRHSQEFQTVLEKHGFSTKEARGVVGKLMAADGNEFRVETTRPGMQHLKERKLKDVPDAELAPFMQKNLYGILNSYMTQAARRAEWAKRMGDDGSRLHELLAQAKEQGASQRDLEVAERFVKGVDGTLGDNLSPELRRLQGNIIVYQNIRLLPLALFSSIIDPMGVLVRGGTVKDAWSTLVRGIREMKHSYSSKAADDEATHLAETLGTIDNAMLVHTLGASYSQGMVGDTGRKINDMFFRLNFMEQFNQSMRVGATQAALGFLKRHADGTASPHSKRWLAELGLKVGDVQLDANGDVQLFQHQGLSEEHEAKMRGAVNRWVDGAVLRPDAADKPIWMNDPHFALIAHLKQFVYSFEETILKRVMHEIDHGNFTPAIALASYVPVMIAADMIKGVIQGGGETPEWKKNWTAGDYVESGVERAGLFGVSQFRADLLKGHAGSLTGPTLEQLGDAVSTIGGRESFGHFAVKALPANALYAKFVGGEATDPKFAD